MGGGTFNPFRLLFFLSSLLFFLSFLVSAAPNGPIPTTPTVPTTPIPRIEWEDDDEDYFQLPVEPPNEKNIEETSRIFEAEEPQPTFEYFVVLDNYTEATEDEVARNISAILREKANATPSAVIDLIMKLSDAEEVYPNELFVIFNSRLSSQAAITTVLRQIVVLPQVEFIERAAVFHHIKPYLISPGKKHSKRTPTPTLPSTSTPTPTPTSGPTSTSTPSPTPFNFFHSTRTHTPTPSSPTPTIPSPSPSPSSTSPPSSAQSSSSSSSSSSSEASGKLEGIPWDLDRVDSPILPLDNCFRPPGTGKGVNVYVVDTGVNVKHPDFGGRASIGWSAFANSGDAEGHGTHVAAIIAGSTYGVAKEATIISVKVLGEEGDSNINQLIGGLNWILSNHKKPAVINLSLSAYGSVTHLTALLQELVDEGILIVSAAGNDDQDACGWTPVGTLVTVAVGATEIQDTNQDKRAYFSNFGSCVDIFAPGMEIPSADYQSDGYLVMSGTSQASPIIAGMAALYLEKYPQANQNQFRQALISAAQKDVVTNAGTGSPNRLALLTDLLGDGSGPAPAQFQQPCWGDRRCQRVQNRIKGSESLYLPKKGIQVATTLEANQFHKAWLIGAGLSLELLKYENGKYQVVRESHTPSASSTTETISYKGEPGIYFWRVTNDFDTPEDFELQYVQPQSCNATTTCNGRGTCNVATGDCECLNGWKGSSCEVPPESKTKLASTSSSSFTISFFGKGGMASFFSLVLGSLILLLS